MMKRCTVCAHEAEDVCIPEGDEGDKKNLEHQRLIEARKSLAQEIAEIEDDVLNGNDPDYLRLADLRAALEEVDDDIDLLFEGCPAEFIQDDETDESDESAPESDPDATDVSHLSEIVYRFQAFTDEHGDIDDLEVVVDSPASLERAPDGAHYIVDTHGIGIIVPHANDAIDITVYPLPGKKPFQNGPLW